MWLLARLPLSTQFYLGRVLGRLTCRLSLSRRHITRTNIDLCFPELTLQQKQQLVRSVFTSTGIGLVETAIAWFGSIDRNRVTIEGLEHLHRAQQQKRGVILVGAHFSTLDIAGAMLAGEIDLDVIYRRNKNPVMEYCMRNGRQQHYNGVIERSDTRQILKRLRQGAIIWYAADQDYGRKHSVFAPFFGQQAATISATGRFARLNDSPVLFMSHFRDPETKTWNICIQPQLQDFPSGDESIDARRINTIIETEIRRHPDQYLWLHRRFKTRPPGDSRPY